MTLSLYMDHQVPAAITEGLRQRGIDVLTAFADGGAQWSDDRLLQRSADLGRALFTMDHDFLVIANDWRHLNREFWLIRLMRIVFDGRLGF